MEKIEWVENERDETKQEAKVARLASVAMGKVKARVKDDLTRARDALAAAEEVKVWVGGLGCPSDG